MGKYQFREKASEEIHKKLDVYPEMLRELLYARKIEDVESAEKYLNPSYENHIHDPFLIKDMDRAAVRILKSILKEEIITIWSDYDHDGIPGGAILHDFFKKIEYKNFNNYIPHRYIEGYGLNSKAIEELAKAGTKLLITVDCGITDVLPVETANKLGIDVIISDHHLTPQNLPKAFAILNSKRTDCDYPFDMLCGAAVAFKLVQALIAKGDFSESISLGWEKWLLDLVGLSTVADMVPLTGENRVIAHYGLKVLRKTRRPGLQKLFRVLNINQSGLTEDDIGFMIAPRINAASRMSDPRIAFDLLTAEDVGKGEAIAKELNKLNDIRKGTVASMIKEMKHTLSQKEEISPVIVMGNPHWQPGLLGLAANNLVEAHTRPVFLWGKEGGDNLKGSCRSDGSVDVVALMREVPKKVFADFGGHKFSGGFQVSYDYIHDFDKYIQEAYLKVKDGTFEEIILIDKKMVLDEVNEKSWNLINKLSPFGIENPKPLFLFENVMAENVRQFGKNKEHLELTFRKENGNFLRAIEFFSARDIKKNRPINLLANIEKSTFAGRTELRLRVVDII